MLVNCHMTCFFLSALFELFLFVQKQMTAIAAGHISIHCFSHATFLNIDSGFHLFFVGLLTLFLHSCFDVEIIFFY